MKIGEARGIYSSQILEYNNQKAKIKQQQEELNNKINATKNGALIYKNEAAALEISYKTINEKQKEYQNYLDQLNEEWNAQFQKVSAKNQEDTAKECGEDIAKILTVARRIMKGDIVPPSDEKKLMDYDSKLYQIAKNIGMMANIQKRQKHKSLWKDEEKKSYEDPSESADNKETCASGPKIISAKDVVETNMEETTNEC